MDLGITREAFLEKHYAQPSSISQKLIPIHKAKSFPVNNALSPWDYRNKLAPSEKYTETFLNLGQQRLNLTEGFPPVCSTQKYIASEKQEKTLKLILEPIDWDVLGIYRELTYIRDEAVVQPTVNPKLTAITINTQNWRGD